MKTKTLLSFIGGALAALAVAAGCSSDSKAPAPLAESGPGQSCARTSDCQSGLLCLENVCSGSTRKADGGVQTTGTGGATSVANLGDQGESCTRRADCKTGLACIRQTCTTGPVTTVAGPDGGVAAPVGIRGESCQNAVDCGPGLICVPRPDQAAGICDLANYGLKPTGKTCSGECATAADCCQLPPGVDVGAQLDAPPVEAVVSCADISQLLGGTPATKCAGTPTGDTGIACFYYQTYCNCAATTWSCTANNCVYAAPCTTDNNVFGGCPTKTRAGADTVSATCNTDSNKCEATASGCTKDADCLGLAIVDDSDDSATCATGECACLTGSCYRKCAKDADCAQRYKCDTGKTSVCIPAGDCATKTDCVNRLSDSRLECQAGACVLPCANDQDCGQSGLTGLDPQNFGFFGLVCGPASTCVDIGCASDDECNLNNDTNIRAFCVAPPTTSGPGYESAVPVHPPFI